MPFKETIEQYYQRRPHANPRGLPNHNAGFGHFNVFLRDGYYPPGPYGRRDFYNVALIMNKGKMRFFDKWIDVDRPVLVFSNPLVPYAWEAESDKQEGWFCVFTEAFIHSNEQKETLLDSPLFNVIGNHLFFVHRKQQKEIAAIFEKMAEEMASDYTHKYDLLRNYLHLIIHAAIKMQPADHVKRYAIGAERTAALFLELLERQFPIDSPENYLQLKTAGDFAGRLSVHANHLNRSVKQVTGMTTTAHIAARIIKEARALLQHSDWDISRIAYSLGFEDPAYFANFFRKHTQTNPRTLRKKPI
jgi:AraC family transcriptional activator of pobA